MSQTPDAPRCGLCQYHVTHESLEAGVAKCRRFPPQVAIDDKGALISAFPTVALEQFCGEFGRKVH